MDTHDVIVIGAGLSGMYQLHRLRQLGVCGAGVRGGRRRRRHLVLEPLSRRALRFRELDLRLFVLRRAAAGVGLERALRGAARDAALPATSSPTSSTCAATSASTAGSRRPRTTTPPPGWEIVTTDGRRARARFLITAIGPLSAPTMPTIPGIETFRGEAFHTGALAAPPRELRGQARRRDRHRRHRRCRRSRRSPRRSATSRSSSARRTGARRCATARSTPRRSDGSRLATRRSSRAAGSLSAASSTTPIGATRSR